MSQSRQLAAIMFTDIVGYTSLMGNDEQKAFDLLKKNREIQKPIIEQFNGRWIKELGDGVMASFNTVSDAVNAAIKIQKACDIAKDFQLRIGIHQGEVVFEADDVFGDAVNISARLQASAKPGCIYVSETVRNNVSNKKDIETRFVKDETLKNVKESVRIYEVISTYSEVISDSLLQEQFKKSSAKSIVVLPFENMSPEKDQDYFCDGITEEIINTLAHIDSLKVIARTTSFSFKGKYADVRNIGKELGVETILEGSLRKSGDRLRITAQLIRVSDGSHIWSEKYDREMKDVFEIQDELSLAIVEELKIQLFEEEKIQLLKSNTQNLNAYNYYLKGRYYWNNSRTKEGIEKTIRYYEQAIDADPEYTLAYAGLAIAHSVSADWGFMKSKKALPKIKEFQSRALELDNSLAEIHSSLMYSYTFIEWKWEKAKEEYKKSIELNPNSPEVHHIYALFQMCLGNFDKAIQHNNIARELDPLSLIFNFASGLILYTARQYDEAISQFRKTLSININFIPAYFWASFCYIQKGLYEEAIDEYQNLLLRDANTEKLVPVIDEIFRNSGINGFLNWLVDVGIKHHPEIYNRPYYLTVCYSLLNEKEKAFEMLKETCELRSARIAMIKEDPGLDNLRDDPEFKTFLDKVGSN
jgi:adenylate cyclase